MKNLLVAIVLALGFMGWFALPAIAFGAYDSPYGTGNRTSDITVTSSGFTWTHNAGSCTSNYEQCFVNGNTTTDQIYAPTNNGQSVTGKYIRFQFPEAIIITEIKIGYSASHPSGTWKTQGSNNGTDWTDVGNTFTFGGSAVDTVNLSSNTTAYYYYQVIGVSGTYDQNDYTREAEFDWVYGIDTTPTVATSTATTGDIVFGLSILITLGSFGLIYMIYNSINKRKPWK